MYIYNSWKVQVLISSIRKPVCQEKNNKQQKWIIIVGYYGNYIMLLVLACIWLIYFTLYLIFN